MPDPQTSVRAYRVDYGMLGDVRRTGQGGLAIPADLTRAGVFSYLQPNGSTINEWRPLAEVSRAATLDSLKHAPFTLKHPPQGEVTPENYTKVARGHVGDDVRMDGAKTAATVYVQDAAAIRAIEGGLREISCGYHQDTEDVAGIVPEGEPDAGKSYHRIQRNIVYNHAAGVPHGRAGNARFRLDSTGNATDDEDTTMVIDKIEVIAGVEYVAGSDAHRAAKQRQDEADKARETDAKKLRADFDEMKGKLDALTADKSKADKALAESLSPQRLDAAVAERSAILDIARAHLGRDFKADGLTNREIEMKVLAKVHPDGEIAETLRTDSAETPVSADYLRGLWAGLRSTKRTDSRAISPVPGAPALHQRKSGGITRKYRADSMEQAPVQSAPRFAISRRNLQSSSIESQR